MCRNPYIGPNGGAFGCGQCTPCRINHKRLWTSRLMLEAGQHETNSFWTLTYSDEFIPLTHDKKQTLRMEHLTLFMKRLRKAYQPSKLRYYNVGEYGTKSGRPHYHLALFNFPACNRGVTRYDRRGYCCDLCRSVEEIWGKGLVYSGQLENDSAAYICGYITKKLNSSHPDLGTREPESARMSLKPAIGSGVIPEIASTLLTHNLEKELVDVPSSIRIGSKIVPLGRTLTRKLRQQIGRSPNAPEALLEARRQELLPLQEKARQTAPHRSAYKETYKKEITDLKYGEALRLENNQKLFSKKRESI